MLNDISLGTALADNETREMATADLRVYGFWVYLMSDLALFAALFATFAALRHNFADGPTPRELFHLSYTFVETIALLCSSLTCGLAMMSLGGKSAKPVLMWLGATLLLGLGFIALEISEFHGILADGYGPGTSAFLSAFFTLVGAHGLHVTAGLIWIGVMLVQIAAKGLSVTVQSRLMRLSMFWHFLDIIWVGVFTMVYLRGVV